jgi:hypothetical protein
VLKRLPKLEIQHKKLLTKSLKNIRKVGKEKNGPKSLFIRGTVHPRINSNLDRCGASKGGAELLHACRHVGRERKIPHSKGCLGIRLGEKESLMCCVRGK